MWNDLASSVVASIADVLATWRSRDLGQGARIAHAFGHPDFGPTGPISKPTPQSTGATEKVARVTDNVHILAMFHFTIG